jgi:hypothetical protein
MGGWWDGQGCHMADINPYKLLNVEASSYWKSQGIEKTQYNG